ncbi:MAG: hypothetical protein EOM26_05330 [Alphaproteobacteria bacterium]|nr:hypothetical protein [Alphaproteobacteria bacterium]
MGSGFFDFSLTSDLKSSFWEAATSDGLFIPNQIVRERLGPPGKVNPVLKNEGSRSVSARNIQSDLPPFSDLPGPIQDFIHSIEDCPEYEKMQLIHDFVNENMAYPDDIKDVLGGDGVQSNADVIANWRYGDCDNRAQLSASLMQYAGFDAKDITFVGGNFDYGLKAPVRHGALVVNIENQHYLMDMNLAEAVPVAQDKNGHFSSSGNARYSEEQVAFDVDVDPFFIVPVEKGEPAFVEKAFLEETAKSLGMLPAGIIPRL